MRNDLRILTIANSFTDSLSVYFQQVAESVPGCSLLFDRANHGGCELHRHWSYILNEEADAVYRMYQNYQYKMREVLAKENWDIVTIQQASHFSWHPHTYQPFADNIAAYIRTYAPQAEIVIQQTWAYRTDDPRFLPGIWDYSGYESARRMGIELPGQVRVSQQEMYEKLTAAYRKLSRELGGLRIIPTGYAVQLSRENEKYPFRPYDQSLMTTMQWPDMPPQAGDVVGRIFWNKNALSGELELGRDTIHLNRRGEYLQACVWFAFLYGRHTDEIEFVPGELSNSDAAFLRRMAQRAVDEFRQESPTS